MTVDKKMNNRFSPLRYWGGLYLQGAIFKSNGKVLVPFDIGVVYIDWSEYTEDNIEF